MSDISPKRTPSNKKAGLLVLSILSLFLLTSCAQGLSQSHPGATTTPKTLPIPTSTSGTTYISPEHNVGVTIVNGITYAATLDQDVYALNTNNGSQRWHATIDGSAEELPSVINGIVYVSSFVGENGPAYLTALRASDGTRLWSFRSNSYIYSPVEQNGILYVAQQHDGIAALRAEDGQQLWHFAGTTEQSPVLNKGLLYIAASENSQPDGIYALHIENGSVAWHYPTSADSSFTLHNDLLYICCSTGTFVALHANNGQQSWKQALDATFIQPPQFVDGMIYIMATQISLGTPTVNTTIFPQVLALDSLLETTIQANMNLPLKQGKSSIYALQLSDGKPVWQQPLNQGKDGFSDWLQVESGVLYAGTTDSEQGNSMGIISALQTGDGKELWHKTIDGSPSGISMNNGILYSIGIGDTSVLYALRIQDGAQIWKYPIQANAYNEPVINQSTISIGASNGMIYALDAKDGKPLWQYQTKIAG